MSGGHEFFRVGADTFCKSAVETVLSILNCSALGCERAITFFSGTIPVGCCVSFHSVIIEFFCS